MNKEGGDNSIRQPRSKNPTLNDDSTLKHFFKSISPRSKVRITNTTINSNCNKENEKSNNTSRGKPPISRASYSKYANVLKTRPQDKDNDRKRRNKIIPNKKDSNTSRPLTAEITLSFTSITGRQTSSNNNNSNTTCNPHLMQKRSKSFNNTITKPITSTLSYIKLQDETNEFKAINAKLQNELLIMNEKVSKLNQEIITKANENKEMQSRYENTISSLREELANIKSTHIPIASIPKPISTIQHDNIIKSILSIIIEISEMLISKTVIRNSSTIQIENSVDVFESYNNNDEERRTSLIDQIQHLLISKILYIQRTLSLTFNKEIERIQNWSSSSSTINQSMTLNIFSPLKNYSTNNNNNKTIKTNEDILNSLSKMYMNSNSTINDFDLSVSGNFYAQSPKFNSFDDEGSKVESVSHHNSNNSIRNSNISNYICSNQKILDKSPLSQTEIVQMMSNDDSLLDSMKTEGNRGNSSEQKDKGMGIGIEDCKKNVDANSNMNALDCSIGDLVSPTNMVNACGNLVSLNKELKENMSNFTLDDVENNDIIGGH